jgi:hypothetical protein
VTTTIPELTTAELRAAFDRARILRLSGWTFERALAAPLVAWSLQKSALAARRTAAGPVQPRLI